MTKHVAEPFMKYAGGKRQLLPELRKVVPENFTAYVEPFVGGGAMFFDLYARGLLKGKTVILADSNERLIRTYKAIRDDAGGVIEGLLQRQDSYLQKDGPGRLDYFLEMRAFDEKLDACSDTAVAWWMIFMNRTCFNGMYRVNAKGRFNVPHGRYDNPRICDRENLIAVADTLKSVNLVAKDFQAVFHALPLSVWNEHIERVFIFADPPYVPLSATSDFTSYGKEKFRDTDQLALRDEVLRIVERHPNANAVLCNSSAPRVKELYEPPFKRIEIDARRAINSKASGRGAIKESLITLGSAYE